jgi:RNase P subunit RPR2
MQKIDKCPLCNNELVRCTHLLLPDEGVGMYWVHHECKKCGLILRFPTPKRKKSPKGKDRTLQYGANS